MKSETILLTGAGGYFGRFVFAELLAAGHQVIGTGRTAGMVGGHRLVPCDLNDPRALRSLLKKVRPSVVVHCAGARATADWPKLVSAYLTTTENLLRESAPVRFLLVSSSTVYGQPRKTVIREEDAVVPVTPYGHVKAAQEQLALSARALGHQVIVARIFNFVGPALPQHLVVGAWIGQIRQQQSAKKSKGTIMVGNIQNRRDFIDVRDAAAAVVALAEDGQDGNIYNVCSSVPTPLAKIFSQLKEISGLRLRPQVNPKLVRPRSEDPLTITGDNKKLRRRTGWKPRISIEQSLTDALSADR